ncbi:MAG: hypothetical protein H6Q15_65 [Bacteroidetes bacterium]|nr:hypothetical protein [Bacteroidota bacterium]
MKRIIYTSLLILLIIPLNIKAQDTNKVYPKIQKVVVYREDAQIEKSITVSLKRGFNEFVLAGNSNVLNTKSIQFNNNPKYSIMEFTPYIQYVKSDQVAEEKLSETTRKKVKVIKDSIEILEYKLVEVINYISVLNKEKIAINDMRVMTNSSDIDTIKKMKDGLGFYREKSAEVNSLIQQKEKELSDLNKSIDEYSSNLKIILQGSEKDNAEDNSEYYIKVNIYSEKDIKKADIDYRYIVRDIYWSPIYDVNFISNNENVGFVLKSELQQKTGEDWDDVKLVFSTEQPNNQGQLAELEPTYYTLRPVQPKPQQAIQQRPQQQKISAQSNLQTKQTLVYSPGNLYGTITDSKTAEPIPFVNIIAEQNGQQKGGTQTDIDGNYCIKSLSAGNYDITSSFVGYKKATKKNVRVSSTGYSTGGSLAMEASSTNLDAVTITEYQVPIVEMGSAETGKRITNDDFGFPSGNVSSFGSSSEWVKYEYATEDNNTALGNKMLGKEYEVAMNYTIKSGDKPKIIPLETSKTKASYKYFSVPKMEKVVYLSALLSDWEDMQLMSAGAKVYLDNNFIKDIYINSNSIEDTLNLPIGREKRVVIDRKSDKKLVTKTGFMSSSFETTVTITLNIKNNTQSIVSLKLDDQIPVSKTDEITITPNDLAKAVYDEKTGKLTWNLNLNALESKTINFSYTVKHPKGANLSFN